MDSLSDQEDIVDGRYDGEREGCIEEGLASESYPVGIDDLGQQHEEYGADLREGTDLSEDARPKIANADGDVKHFFSASLRPAAMKSPSAQR